MADQVLARTLPDHDDNGMDAAAVTSNTPQDTTATLKYFLLGPSLTKAGQDTVDQAKVSEIIYNASKGSKFFEREAAKDEILTHKIEAILARKRTLEQNLDGTLEREACAADALLAELELGRDLTQVIVHVDCDAFYAAVEQLHRPELAGVPFAVGIGVLTTCNYVARKYGCRSGMAGFVAKKLCPELVQLPNDFARYGAKAEEVREVLAEYDARFESISVDEAYLNLTAYCRDTQSSPADAVQRMRAQIHERTGITVSAGIAANARLAKICSNVNKPNGQYLLPSTRAAIVAFMATLPPRKVNGIGRVLERELAAVGVATCGDVYAQRALLRPLFGEKAAHFLLAVHLGLGRTSVQPAETYERKSIGTERTFADEGDPAALRERLRQTAHDLEADMRRAQCRGRTLCLKIKMHTYEVHTRQVAATRRLLGKADDMYALALPMLEKLEREFPRMRIRLMGLRCMGLVSTRKPDADAFFGLKTKPAVVRHGGRAGRESDGVDKGHGGQTTSIDEVEGAWDSVKDDADDELARAAIKLSQGVVDGEDHSKENDWWDCPVCMRPQPADERVFNQHIDLCLSRQTIRDAVQDVSHGPNSTIRETTTSRHSPSGTPTTTTAKSLSCSRKRPHKGGTAPDPRQKKLCFG